MTTNPNAYQAMTVKSSVKNGLIFFDNSSAMKGIDKAFDRLANANSEIFAYAAIGMINLVGHGDPTVLNGLYFKLASDDRTAVTANALRVEYSNAIIDRYGVGGRTVEGLSNMYNSDGQRIGVKWEVRPPAIFDFARPTAQKPGGFEIVRTRKPDGTLPDKMTEETVKNIRATKQKIIDAVKKNGVEVLMSIPWISAAEESNRSKNYNEKWLTDTIKKTLTTASKFAFENGITANDISQAGKMFGVSGEDIKKIIDLRRENKPPKVEKMATTETLADIMNTIDGETGEEKPEEKQPAQLLPPIPDDIPHADVTH